MSGRRKAKAILSPPLGQPNPIPTYQGQDPTYFYFLVPADFTPEEMLRAEQLVDGGMTPEEAIAQVIDERTYSGLE